MAVMRKHELRETTSEGLKKKLAEIEQEILAEYGTLKATGKPSNAGRYKELRKLRARIKTILNKRGIKL